MKKIVVNMLTVSLLLFLIIGVDGRIEFTPNTPPPSIGAGGFESCTKYTDIVTGAVRWQQPNLNEVAVSIGAEADGVGEGLGTLRNVTILGNTYATYSDPADTVGTTDSNGSWTEGTRAHVGTDMYLQLPAKAEAGSYSWSSGGDIMLTPYVWQESITRGGAIHWPLGVSGRFSTTGQWKLQTGSRFSRSAASNSGTHTVSFKYECRACDRIADTEAALGGKDAHKVIVCPGDNCNITYHKCQRPTNHQIHDACGERLCNGKNHNYVGPCSECGKTIYECSRNKHALQASCPINITQDGTNVYCRVSNFYACEDPAHTCDFPPSSNNGNGGSGSTDTTDTTTTDTSSTTDDDDDDTDSDSDTDDDDSSSGNSIGPASGYSDTGTAGLSYAVKLTSSGALDQVKWYLKGPGDSSATLWSTNDYYGYASESTFYYCFPGSISGDYEFTAEVKPRGGDSYSTSFTVSVTTD